MRRKAKFRRRSPAARPKDPEPRTAPPAAGAAPRRRASKGLTPKAHRSAAEGAELNKKERTKKSFRTQLRTP